MEMRQIRGLEIAKQKQIRKTIDGWLVPSQSGSGFYRVDEEFNCNCPDCRGRNVTCKHAYAVRYYLQVERETPLGIKSERVAISGKQAWKAYISSIDLFYVLLLLLYATMYKLCITKY
jgi:hypothetical protein